MTELLQVRIGEDRVAGLKRLAKSRGQTLLALMTGVVDELLSGGAGSSLGMASSSPAMPAAVVSAPGGPGIGDLLAALQELVEASRDQTGLLEQLVVAGRVVGADDAPAVPTAVPVALTSSPA